MITNLLSLQSTLAAGIKTPAHTCVTLLESSAASPNLRVTLEVLGASTSWIWLVGFSGLMGKLTSMLGMKWFLQSWDLSIAFELKGWIPYVLNRDLMFEAVVEILEAVLWYTELFSLQSTGFVERLTQVLKALREKLWELCRRHHRMADIDGLCEALTREMSRCFSWPGQYLQERCEAWLSSSRSIGLSVDGWANAKNICVSHRRTSSQSMKTVTGLPSRAASESPVA